MPRVSSRRGAVMTRFSRQRGRAAAWRPIERPAGVPAHGFCASAARAARSARRVLVERPRRRIAQVLRSEADVGELARVHRRQLGERGARAARRARATARIRAPQAKTSAAMRLGFVHDALLSRLSSPKRAGAPRDNRIQFGRTVPINGQYRCSIARRPRIARRRGSAPSWRPSRAAWTAARWRPARVCPRCARSRRVWRCRSRRSSRPMIGWSPRARWWRGAARAFSSRGRRARWCWRERSSGASRWPTGCGRSAPRSKPIPTGAAGLGLAARILDARTRHAAGAARPRARPGVPQDAIRFADRLRAAAPPARGAPRRARRRGLARADRADRIRAPRRSTSRCASSSSPATRWRSTTPAISGCCLCSTRIASTSSRAPLTPEGPDVEALANALRGACAAGLSDDRRPAQSDRRGPVGRRRASRAQARRAARRRHRRGRNLRRFRAGAAGGAAGGVRRARARHSGRQLFEDDLGGAALRLSRGPARLGRSDRRSETRDLAQQRPFRRRLPAPDADRSGLPAPFKRAARAPRRRDGARH